MTPIKMGLTAFPNAYELPSRPSGTSADAYRQTNFLLGDDLALFERLMSAQLRIVAANSKARSLEASVMFMQWSRVFSQLADACLLLTRGSYASCMPLLRSACDCVAVQVASLGDDYGEYRKWFEAPIMQDKPLLALSFEIGRGRAGSVYAEDPELGLTFRIVNELSMPHFGSTALLTATDSSLQKLSIAFADQAFHYGWAQLVLGWILRLTARQTRAVLECEALAVPEDTATDAQDAIKSVEAMLADRRRSYVEDVGGRWVFYNFRRTASGQPKRVVLG